MSITYGELKKRILKKIDEYEADVEGWTDDEDLINKMPDAVNEAIRFVFYAKGHEKTWNVKQGTPINALERKRSDPDYKPLYGEHRNEDIVFEDDAACAYYFEVDDTATVTVENWGLITEIVPDVDEHGDPILDENDEPVTHEEYHEGWVTLTRIDHVNEQPFSEYKGYKGRITQDGSATRTRIVFSGSYYYKYKNVCLHSVAYSTDEKVPEYTGYRQHEIPKNLYQIVQAYKGENGVRKNVSYYTEDYKLYLPDAEGTVFLVSKFFPDPVDEETENEYVIDIPIDTEWIVVSKAAAILTMEGEASEFINDEEQYMQMLEGDRGRSGAPKVVRLH